MTQIDYYTDTDYYTVIPSTSIYRDPSPLCTAFQQAKWWKRAWYVSGCDKITPRARGVLASSHINPASY